ncbi:helix-turn-helix domain-containing protein [Olsenella sp. Marseille-P4559]|uniref:helix-turn-helix domain-containing protein n=1 Tax=Olsenella sp. Marseille-P4559 TaxID=2364795 RepID=UPI001A911DE7|nr:helix-turn-helix domain-containing protein [Olsenella sp. Marseille-P4559]
MAGNALCDVALRMRAAELYDEGRGRASVAALLGVPEETVRQWLSAYESVGIEALALMGARKTACPFETKAAAVRAVVGGGMTEPGAMARFGICSPSAFKRWLRAYRGGAGAPGPKPKGGPPGPKPRPARPTREQGPGRRVQRLGAERTPT